MIGSVIAGHLNLIQNRDDLIIVDHISDSEKWQNLVHRKYAQYLDRDTLWDWLDKHSKAVSAVIHMGAISASVGRDFQAMLNYNINYSQRLWEWCSTHNCPFLYASSAATYGDGTQGYNDASLDNLRPLNAYGYAKHFFDQWVMRQVQNEAPCPPYWAGFKFFNVYGANEYHKKRMASVVFHTFQQFRSTGSVRLFKSDNPNIADGEQVRDFIYVKDATQVVCYFLKCALESLQNAPPSSIYNVGTGQARSFKDLAIAVMRSMGATPNITYVDMPTDLQGKYQYFTQAKTDKLRQAGAPIPSTSLEDGVADYVQNYLSKNDPYF